jgi:hypothetical protein
MPGSWPAVLEYAAARLPRRARSAVLEGTGAELSDHHQRPGACHDPGEGCVSKLGYSLRGEASLWTAPSPGVAGQDPGARPIAAKIRNNSWRASLAMRSPAAATVFAGGAGARKNFLWFAAREKARTISAGVCSRISAMYPASAFFFEFPVQSLGPLSQRPSNRHLGWD